MNNFGWDLPPGCTVRHIEDQIGDECDACGYELEDGVCENQRCVRYERDYAGEAADMACDTRREERAR